MAFKFEIGDPKTKKTFHLEAEAEGLIGRNIGETVKGEEISEKLSGAEFMITGTSDKAGFPGMKDSEGPYLRRILLTRGKGMREKGKGLRKRKTVRGNTISADTVQINLKTVKSEKSIGGMLGISAEAKPEEKK